MVRLGSKAETGTKKRNTYVFPFWRFGVVHRTAFFKCEAGLGLPKNSVACKLVYIDTTRPIRKKCRGTMCRRTMVRQGYEVETGTKKGTQWCSFLAFRCGTPQHKKKNTCVFFLAPVEGLGPPTLRLTAECSTD